MSEAAATELIMTPIRNSGDQQSSLEAKPKATTAEICGCAEPMNSAGTAVNGNDREKDSRNITP